ncbi:MAG: tetratricopeptide repeat protein [Bacteroidota bacterium]|nr:tetratricopeptide repeat protein [Bacteroidota bacterium]
MANIYYKILMVAFILICMFFIQTNAQVNTDSLYNAAVAMKDPIQKIKALDDLLNKYPTIDNAEGIRSSLFITSLETKDTLLVMQKAQELIKNAVDVATIYNRVAYYFAANGFWLDSALAYSTVANEEYEKAQGRKRVPFMDTKARVYFKRGEYTQALETQRQALAIYPKEREWDPNYAEYYFNLALYMYQNNLLQDGLRLMARTSFFGFEDATKLLDEIFQKEKLQFTKSDIYKAAADEYLKAATDINVARSVVALGLAKQSAGGRLLDEAYELANAGVDAIDANTSFEQESNRYTTLGVINVIRGDYKTGIENLNRAIKYSTPYDTDLYFYLGKAYEQIGENKKAFDTYLAGVLAFSPENIMERLKALHPVLYIHGPALDEIIKTEVLKTENFEVAHFNKPKDNNKVVLAELFTGSECRPCLASDYAYDKLIERYDSNTLAVLEYHLHIPAPDPMTNSDTEARAKFYGVNSTPTSIIEGTDKSSAGGNKAVAKSRFNVFTSTIENFLSNDPKANISLKSSIKKKNLSISCNSSTSEINTNDLRLHIVLAEEKVHYKGYNTVAEHRFVVRKMFPSSEGLAFGNQKELTYSNNINLNQLEDSLKVYLDSMEKRANRKVFKEKKYQINPDNLFLVAFVQNNVTKEIIQASVTRVKK